MAESIFISSCSRRELARRRPGRPSAVASALLVALIALVVLAVLLGAVAIARGGI